MKKKILAIVLVVAMLFSMNCPALAAVLLEGSNGTTVYLAMSFLDENQENPVSSAAAEDWVALEVKMIGNPTDENTVKNIGIILQFDNSKFSFDSCDKGLVEPQVNEDADGALSVVIAGWAGDDGILVGSGKNKHLEANGTLYTLWFEAKQDVAAADFASSFRFLDQYMLNNVETLPEMGQSRLVTLPDLSVTVGSGRLFTDSTAEDVKAQLTVAAIEANADFTGVVANPVDASAYEVVLPDGGLAAGENACSVSYNGASLPFTVTAEAVVLESLEKSGNVGLSVVSGEKLDLANLSIIGRKNNGGTAEVNDYSLKLDGADFDANTALTVAAANGKTLSAWKDGLSVEIGTVTVAPKSVPVPVIDGSFTYNGGVQNITLTDTADYSVSGDVSGTDAGSYTAVVTLTDAVETVWADNAAAARELPWSIAPNDGDLTVTLAYPNDPIVYDGSEKKPALTVMSGSIVLDAGSYDVLYGGNTDAGSAAVSVTGTGNYAGATGGTTFTIAPAEITVGMIAAIPDQIFNGAALEPAVSVNDGKNSLSAGDFTVSYRNNVNAGTAMVTVSGQGNYSGSAEVSFAINKAVAADSYAAVYSMYYADAVTKAMSVSDFGLPGDAGTIVIGTPAFVSGDDILENFAAASFSLKSGAESDRTAVLSVVISSDNYEDITATVTVNTVNIQIDWPTLTLNPAAYGATNADIFPAFDEITKVGTAYTDHAFTGTFSVQNPDAVPNAGAYDAVLVFTPDANSGVSGEFTMAYPCVIAQKTLTVSFGEQTKTYGETDPELSYSFDGALDGEKAAFTGAPVRDAGENAGEYAVTQGTLALADNGSFLAANYSLSFSAAGKLTIEPKLLADAVIEDISPETYTGSPIEPVPAVTDSAAIDSGDYSFRYENNLNAGTATLTITGKRNYQGTVDKFFSIEKVTPAAADISVVYPAALVYDGSAKAVSVTSARAGIESLKAVYSGDGGVTWTEEAPVNAGEYQVRVQVAETANCNAAALDFAAFTIEKAELSGSFGTSCVIYYEDSETKLVKAEDFGFPADAGTVTVGTPAFVSGDDILENFAAGSFSLKAGAAAGKAAVLSVVISSDNYKDVTAAVNVSTTDITVNWPELTLNQISYGAANAALFPAFDENGTAQTDKPVTGRFSVKNADAVPAAGTASAVLVFTPDAEFGISPIEKTYTCPAVDQAVLTLIPQLQSKTFGEADPAMFDFMISGIVDNEPVDYEGAIAREPGEDAGSYGFTMGSFALKDNGSFLAANYIVILDDSMKFTVNAKALTDAMVGDIAAQTFTGAALEPVVVAADGKTLIADTDYSVSHAAAVNAGDYTVSVSGLGNYSGTVEKTFTVSPKALADEMLQAIAAQTFTGAALEPVVVKDGETVLTVGSDYSAEYTNNVNAGTATFVVNGLGNYSGSLNGSFPIGKAVLSGSFAASFSLNYKDVEVKTLTGAGFGFPANAGTAVFGTPVHQDGEELTENLAAGSFSLKADAAPGKTEELSVVISSDNYEDVTAVLTVRTEDIVVYVPGVYLIKAEAGEGGSISPEGKIKVAENDEVTFSFTADEGYELAEILVDGESLEPADSYTFAEVVKGHTIKAVFAEKTEEIEVSYPDVDDDRWFAEAVRYVTVNGIMQGTDVGFEPYASGTRGQIALMLWRLAGKPAPEAASCFPDVEEGSCWYDAVLWAAEMEIVNGYEDGLFRPERPVTREQLVAMLFRYAKATGADVSVGEDTNILSYEDCFSISGYAIPAFQWACGEGIIVGDELGYLNPKKEASRAEIAAIFMRFTREKEIIQ